MMLLLEVLNDGAQDGIYYEEEDECTHGCAGGGRPPPLRVTLQP